MQGARLARFTNREALQVGTGMISRGEVGLIVAVINDINLLKLLTDAWTKEGARHYGAV
jgi:hypothetical protein